MTIYIVGHERSDFVKIFAEELMQKRILAKTLDNCLCELDNEIQLETPSIVISHPLRDDNLDYLDCWQGHKELITKREDIQFYLFTLGLENKGFPRQRYIGSHPNLTYITKDNIKQVFDEIILKGVNKS